MGRKYEKGERFRMLFEDGKYYTGTVVGCLDMVLKAEEATKRAHEIGVPWESLLVCVRVRSCVCSCVRCLNAVLCVCVCVQVRWDDGDKHISTLNPWETTPVVTPRPSRGRVV